MGEQRVEEGNKKREKNKMLTATSSAPSLLSDRLAEMARVKLPGSSTVGTEPLRGEGGGGGGDGGIGGGDANLTTNRSSRELSDAAALTAPIVLPRPSGGESAMIRDCHPCAYVIAAPSKWPAPPSELPPS